MHNVDQLFKQDEVTWDRAYSRADENGIEPVRWRDVY